MKQEIDNLASQIRAALVEESAPKDQIYSLLRRLRLKGVARAVDLRKALTGYVDDPHLSPEDRAYAKQQLENLPMF